MVAYQTVKVTPSLTGRARRSLALSQPQLHLLCVLKAARGGPGIGEIARATARAAQTVTTLVGSYSEE
jgi:hypothetical protein